jgi:ABC-2 type transport system ATP-binding protein
MPLLSVREIVKDFSGVRAVDHVSFEVREGSITGLLGRNGAGKTTTIRMITGIFMPDSGAIEWSDNSRHTRDRIGYLPEERGLYRQMKVVEELVFLAEIKGYSGPQARRDIDKWLSRFELTEKRDSKVEELSKGNQQKVQLIGTLLHNPDLIVLDEPQSGLDPVNMILIRDVLQELKSEGRTILLSTHMMAEAERLADDIVVIHRGKVVLSGSLDQVKGSFGRNTLHLDFEGDGSFLRDLSGVGKISLQPRSAEISLADPADAQRVIAEAVAKLKIQKIEIASPSLEQIFISKVGADVVEAAPSK